MFTLTTTLFTLVLCVVAISGAAWGLMLILRALEGIEYHAVESRTRPGPIPQEGHAQWYHRVWARLAVCPRKGHEEVYAFRLARPAYACCRCGRWRPRVALVTWPRERRS